jgi:predicted  nucleic acid-binding Zn-ribbon protein
LFRQFNSAQEELEYWRAHSENLENTLQDTRAALDEFQVSSRELEEELEKELQTTEKAYNDLKSRCEHFKRDAENWKVKYFFLSLFSEYSTSTSQNIQNLNMNRTLQWFKCREKLTF